MGRIFVQVGDETPTDISIPEIGTEQMYNTLCDLYCRLGWRREQSERQSVFFRGGRDPITVSK
ncbi:MAG: hypothetical protein R2932_09920 [Caldilineaceae bacterium]